MAKSSKLKRDSSTSASDKTIKSAPGPEAGFPINIGISEDDLKKYRKRTIGVSGRQLYPLYANPQFSLECEGSDV